MQAKPPSFDARGDTPGPSDDRGSRAQTTLDFAVGMSLFLISVAFVISFTPNLVQPFSDSGTEDTVIANRAASQLVEGTLVNPDEPYVLDKACTIAFFAPENSDGLINDQDLNDSNDRFTTDDDGTFGHGDSDPRDMYDISTDSLWTGNSCNFDVNTYLHARLGIAGIDENGDVDRAQSPGLQIEIYGDADDDGDSHLLCIDSNEQPGPDTDSGNAPEGADPDVEDPIVESEDNNAFNDGDPCDAAENDADIPFQVGENPPDDTGSVVVARRVVTIDGIRATVFVRVW